MSWIVALFFIVLLVVAYVWLVRPILVKTPVLSEAFKAEASFFDKLRAKLSGWKTKLTARFFMLASVAVGFYDFVLPIMQGQDWTTMTAQFPAWAVPAATFALSLIFGFLRYVTENPPQVITQRMPDGSVQIVAINKSQE